MAENGQNSQEQSKTTDCHPLHFSSYNIENDVDKEARLRYVKERQNEERQRKLEEIKAQALAAQRFKEQKEQERRQRLEEMRVKEDSRRHQVEERKRAINDAERARLESIINRNHEREARIDLRKKHERSNIVFAFGSSTPRNLDPTDASVSYWGARRAASTQNIMLTSMTGSTLTRRQSERELESGSKKRATSAGGLDRSIEAGSISPSIPAGSPSGYLGRRRTDLVPTIPSRDSSLHSSASRRSLNQSPGRAYSMTRLDQLAKPRKISNGLPALNESSLVPNRSVTRSMSHLAHVGKAPLSRNPVLNKSDSRSMHHLSVDGRPVAPPRVNKAAQLRQQKLLLAQQSSSTSEASSRPSSSMSQQSTTSITNSVNMRHRKSATPRRPRPASIAGTGVTIPEQKDSKPPLPTSRKSVTKSRESSIIKSKSKEILLKSDNKPEIKKKPEEKPKEKIDKEKSVRNIGKVEVKTPPEPVQKTENNAEENKVIEKIKQKVEEGQLIEIQTVENNVIENKPVENIETTTGTTTKVNHPIPQKHQEIAEFIKQEIKHHQEIHTKNQLLQGSEESNVAETQPQEVQQDIQLPQAKVAPNAVVLEVIPPTASVISESKEGENNENIMSTSMIKSRITTEEEAKAALAENRRLAREEAERKAREDAERIEAEQKAELERQRKEEEEIHRLAEMQRRAEQERLQEAIRDAQKREEEERLKREEEQRLKIIKEEADKKAREEAERQKLELQEKFKNEEKEREERRKRVEMIMSRTRGKNSANSQQNSQDKNENKSENNEENKLNEENKMNEENKLNGTKQENGTKENSKEQENGMVDNIIPDGSVKNNANTIITDERISTTDTLNSNSAWQASQQYGGNNLLCNNNS